MLRQLAYNAEVARSEKMPICQDTGIAVIFAVIGQDVHITGGLFEEAIQDGIAKGYTEGYLRKSLVADPLFTRDNTNDNTPAVIHTRIIAGDKLRITVASKGAGSENHSALAMLSPTDGLEGVKKFVLNCVSAAGSNPCPPMTVGVGIGGNMEMAALCAKKAAIRATDSNNADARYHLLENELLNEINRMGIGPLGIGGTTTALKVNIEHFPTHMASLPVAVNINCHAVRHASAEL
jgi:fumarate hydratase subunit alpha